MTADRRYTDTYRPAARKAVSWILLALLAGLTTRYAVIQPLSSTIVEAQMRATCRVAWSGADVQTVLKDDPACVPYLPSSVP